jgi:RNA polymerase sigma-70 factor (ECF subfamily)
MNHVVRHYLLDITRRAAAKKRKGERSMASLNEPIIRETEESDDLTLEETVPDKTSATRLAWLPLQIDLATVLTRLTPQQQAICRLLTEGETVTVISRSLKVPRTTLYDEIKRVRRIFRDAGLKDYLE